MKKIIVFLAVLLIVPMISGEIIISNPQDTYNIGDKFSVTSTVKSVSETEDFFQVFLVCNSQEKELHKEYIFLPANQEKRIATTILLSQSFIGTNSATCHVRSAIGTLASTTKNFAVTNLITIEVKEKTDVISPGDNLIIEGTATKSAGEAANGFIEVKVDSIGETYYETISDGKFNINVTLPKDTEAGQHTFTARVYEKNKNNEVSNEGNIIGKFDVKQIPTNLEIILDEKSIEPGQKIEFKTVLHDQTGKDITAQSKITIKKQDGFIEKQTEIENGNTVEHQIIYKETPSTWKIIAESNGITSEESIEIRENEEVSAEIINKTLIIKNVGNVLYDKTLTIKLGNESFSEQMEGLKIDGQKKWVLSAPEGSYLVEVFEGNNKLLSQRIELTEQKRGFFGLGPTGSAISLKGDSDVTIHPLIWFFLLLILAIVAFLVYNRVRKKNFFGKEGEKPKQKESEDYKVPRGDFLAQLVHSSRNRAELALSIKGEKQDVEVIGLKIKNKKGMTKEGGAFETLKKIIDLSADKKVVVYENIDYLFFIIAPSLTKTFKNGKATIGLGEEIREILNNHNKMFQQKIEYGLAINRGSIVSKKDENSFKFMSLGNLLNGTKKLASVSEGELLISKESNEKMPAGTGIKTERGDKDGTTFYKIKEIKGQEDHTKFINSFLSRIDKK